MNNKNIKMSDTTESKLDLLNDRLQAANAPFNQDQQQQPFNISRPGSGRRPNNCKN